jgi:hypothetical protein
MLIVTELPRIFKLRLRIFKNQSWSFDPDSLIGNFYDKPKTNFCYKNKMYRLPFLIRSCSYLVNLQLVGGGAVNEECF